MEIHQGFQSCLSHGGITGYMGKQFSVRIASRLLPILSHHGLCDDCSVVSQKLSADHPVRHADDPGIIWIVDHILALELEKGSHIESHGGEHTHHAVCKPQDIFIGPGIWPGLFHLPPPLRVLRCTAPG